MNVKTATEITGGLSYPSKMPGPSYNLPASRCITGSKLRKAPNSPCALCYAQKGKYRIGNVKFSLERRYQSLDHPQWVDAMVFLINHHTARLGQPFMRWHDSGDLQSVGHLARIIEVAQRTPSIKHWLPTMERTIVREYLADSSKAPIPSNLALRISSTQRDVAPVLFDGLLGSMVHDSGPLPTGVHLCPAKQYGNKCGPCRACWDKSVDVVAYKKH